MVVTPRGQLALKVCAPGPSGCLLILSPTECSFGQKPRSFCSPSLECLLLILPPLLYYIRPGVSPYVLWGSGSRNLLFNHPLLPPSAQECSRLSAFEGEKLYPSPLASSTPGMCGLGSYTVPAADLQGSFACADNHDLALWPPQSPPPRHTLLQSRDSAWVRSKVMTCPGS